MNGSATYSLDPAWKIVLLEHGVRPEDALRTAGLPDDLLQRANVRLDGDAHRRFCQAVDDAIGDPLLPIWMAEQLDASTFSPPLFTGLCSPNLAVACARIARFKTVVAPVRLDVTHDGPLTVAFTMIDGAPRQAPMYESFELLFFVKLARMGTRKRVEPVRVRARSIPQPSAEYAAFLGCEIEEGPAIELMFSEEDAVRPFLTSNPGMWQAFEPELRRRLAELEASATFAERTQAVLMEALPAGITDVGSVARRLALSPRTLQRRLRDEGTSFKDIVRELRTRLSLHYLINTTTSASEIAYLLGFDQPSSFFRAFHEWTGCTPESVRTMDTAPSCSN